MRIIGLSAVLCGLLAAVADGQAFSGTYSSAASGVTYALTMSQSSDGAVTGTLSSSAGLKLKVEGTAEEDEAGGTCQRDEELYYFEAGFQDGKLQFSLVGTDAEGAPDFENTKSFIFTRQGGRPKVEEPPKTGSGKAGGTSSSAKPAAASADNEVGDPSWGFKFSLPKGWKQQTGSQGALLGHDTIAGMILVLSHRTRSLEQLEAQMQEGLEEEEAQLSLAGGLKTAGENSLSGEYTGMYEGKEVKAHGIGTLSPYGGGAYIIALAAPGKFSSRLSAAADAVARSIRYKRAEASGLMRYFVGTWVNSTKNTQTRITFRPDGTFSEFDEASYSGSSSDQSGQEDLNWGSAGNGQIAGHWTVRGTREQGVLTITYESGKEREVQYRVHVENGETYWSEYYFAGDLYGKQQGSGE
jgi:hypothetical protein